MGILVLSGGGNTHQRQRLINAGFNFFLAAAAIVVNIKRLSNLFPHSQHRVQGSHGVLEDHGDLIATDLAHIRFRQLHDVLALKGDAAGGNFTGTLRQKAHKCQCECGFTGTSLAYQAQGSALFQRQSNTVNGIHCLQIGFINYTQVLNL